MRKIYVFALCFAVCLSASAEGARFKSVRGSRAGKIAVKEVAAPVWRPLSQTDYMHDGEDWMEMGTVTFRYDRRGNCTEEIVNSDDMLTRVQTTYNDNDLPLTVIETESDDDGATWTNIGRTSYVYDSKIRDFFVDRSGYDWDGADWARNYRCETNTITRNADGNITEIVKALPYGEEMLPAYRSVWTYGADGRASGYGYYVMDGSDWALYDDVEYKDIKWHGTDGQMTVFGDLLELTEGANLLESAVVYYQGEADGHYLVEYSDDLPGFLIKETTNDINEVGRTTLMETLDMNGSLRLTTTEFFDEEGNISTEPAYISVQEAMMDEHGNMTQFNLKETYEGTEELVASTIYTYTYDALGNVTEVVSREYDYDSQEYFLSERTVYGEYGDTAGIGSAGADDAAVWSTEGYAVTARGEGLTAVTVYNVQGVLLGRVAAADGCATVSAASLRPGIYVLHAEGIGSTMRFAVR